MTPRKKREFCDEIYIFLLAKTHPSALSVSVIKILSNEKKQKTLLLCTKQKRIIALKAKKLTKDKPNSQ
jgi:hypothetical protein